MYLDNFMSKHLTITILVILLTLLISPQMASAFFPFEGPLVPCGRDFNGNGKIDPAEECTLCHFFVVAQNIIYLFLTLIVFVSTAMIAIGAFILLTSGGIPEKVTHGKRVITYTIIGLAIAFCSWMLINQTMLLLVGEGRGEGGAIPWFWDKIECEVTVPGARGETGGETVGVVPVYV